MCGIAGIVHTDPRKPVDPGLLDRMRDALTHRGPDDYGSRIFGNLGLGHRRLSIIDLSPDGRQPMCNEDGTVWITYNGEVYNFPELRRELEAKGHRFASRTDTEVIIHLHEEYGPDAVKQLRGMFAYALWDGRTKELVLARDRLGIKPLYYFHDASCLAFASELKALLAHPAVPREIDLLAVDSYLSMLFVPGSQAIFRHVSKLPAGSYGVWNEGRLTLTRYWDIPAPDETPHREVDLDELERRVSEAVRIRLVADVPLGVFLSGGIDSSIVTALAAKVSPDPVRTFTISFRGNPLDEAPYAQLVSQRYGTQHTEIQLAAGDLTVDLVMRIVGHFDEPFADASAIPTFLLSQTTRRHVTVALSGDGGDELFAGYEHHLSYSRITGLQRRLPQGLRRGIAALARVGLEPAGLVLSSRSLRRFSKAASWLDLSPLDLIVRLLTYWEEKDKKKLYGPRFAEIETGVALREWYRERTSSWPVQNDLPTCLYANLRTSLCDDMLAKVDRMSMYHALEVRVPLLDHLLTEHAFSLRADSFLHDGIGKLPLRRLAERLLPKEIVNRPKQGFHVPLEFLANREFAELIHDTLHPDRVRRQGFFRPEAVSEIVAAFEDRDNRFVGRMSRYQVNHRLWSLLMFTLWHDTYASSPAPAATNAQQINGQAACPSGIGVKG